MKRAKLITGDIPDEAVKDFSGFSELALDCEMMGLKPRRDRLCIVQITTEPGPCYLMQIDETIEYPNLKSILENENIIKIFHFARMDCLYLRMRLNIVVQNLFCTKIASRLARTYTDKHGLKDLVRELTGKQMDKTSQTSDWGNKDLTDDQIFYAETDVKYLFLLKEKLITILKRENRYHLARESFKYLTTRIELDSLEYNDIFEH